MQMCAYIRGSPLTWPITFFSEKEPLSENYKSLVTKLKMSPIAIEATSTSMVLYSISQSSTLFSTLGNTSIT